MKTRIAFALCFAVSLAACTNNPIAAPNRSGNPRYDGGWTAGSGNRAASDSTLTTNAASDTECKDGGWTAGSGNVVDPCTLQ